jgi:hypothetical protein
MTGSILFMTSSRVRVPLTKRRVVDLMRVGRTLCR